MDSSNSTTDNQTTVHGNVKTESGDFVSRDKRIQGDEIDGDKVLGNKIVNLFSNIKYSRTRVILTIHGDFDSFSEKDQLHLQRIIAEALHMSEPVDIHKIERGSIKVTLELPTEKAEELYEIVKSGNLKSYNIVDAQLVKRLKKGEQSAWEELVNQYSEPIYNYLYWSLLNRQAADEIIVKWIEKAMQMIHHFDGRVELSVFLYSLAQREVVNFWSKPRDLSESVTDLEIRPEAAELIEALKQMDVQLRSALILRYKMGMGANEIAGILGKSYKATESLLSRGRSRLREVIGEGR